MATAPDKDLKGSYRVRYRFRVQKTLNIKAHDHEFSVAGQPVKLSAQESEIAIADSPWLVLNATGFSSESEARDFGEKLKTASEISSVACRQGLDSGQDLVTSRLAPHIKAQIKEEHGVSIRDNVHGLDVFFDTGNTRFFLVKGEGSLSKDPAPFLDDLENFLRTPASISHETKDIILLLNYSLMRPEPIAQIVFAVSAVEALGQREQWSDPQKELLAYLSDQAHGHELGTETERQEVADAIRKSLHRLSLRQGVMRLLDAHELSHLKKPWDKMYEHRSSLIHGLAPKPGADYTQLAFETVTICGQILLRIISEEIKHADRHADKFYIVQQK